MTRTTQQFMGDMPRRTRAHRATLSTLPIAALLLVTACGTEEEPEVSGPPATSDTTPSEEPTATTEPEPTEEETTEEATGAEPTTEEATEEEPTEDETTEVTQTSAEPPVEGTGEALPVAEEYVDHVASGDLEAAYSLLSPEALVYYPDVETFEQHGVANLAADLADASGEPQIAVRSAYEETHDSAQVVSLWGETTDGEPFAHSFAIRNLDGVSWVIDQDITPSTGQSRLNWLNPGIQEGVDEWVVNPDNPIMFALLKHSGPNVAVTASINDGSEVSQELTELPTDGAVMYELSDSDLPDGVNAVTASWVAEDEPFVHTSSTPAMNP